MSDNEKEYRIDPKVTYDPTLMERGVILSVRHLKQYFGNRASRTKAVHDVSFEIKEGECFGIVGESGCGKTTTGRSIIRLYDITSGSIYYKGYRIAAGSRWNEKEIKWSRIRAQEQVKALKAELKEILEKDDFGTVDPDAITAEYNEKISAILEENKTHCEAQKSYILQNKYDHEHVSRDLMNEIQMIFQDPIDSLDPRMTVEDIIQEGLKIQGHNNKQENHQMCVEMLEKVGLIPEYASRYPHEFSGGQRQRIGIARALIMNPRFLICDEPISALDVSIRAQIINLLNDLKEELGLTIMFIAHDLSVVKYFCDTIAVMYFGNMVEKASSDELFRHPLHPYTQALLSAIPKPDPRSEKNRVRKIYRPSEVHDYSKQKPTFQEVVPGHFVLCNDEECAKYRAQIAEMDKANAQHEAELEAVNKMVDEQIASKKKKEAK